MKAQARVQTALQKEFGVTFVERAVELGITIGGQNARKKFDAVSPDGKIIAMVKDFSARNLAGNQTRHARVIRDLYFLSLVSAQHKFMYLSPAFVDWFKTQLDAVVAKDIEVRAIPEANQLLSTMTTPQLTKPSLSFPIGALANPVICESQRYQRKPYLYWWDVWPRRRELMGSVGEIHFIKKDTGEKAVVKAASLLPLLTQSRQTSRGAGNWGIKVLPDRPGEVAIEEPRKNPRDWPRLSVTWVRNLTGTS